MLELIVRGKSRQSQTLCENGAESGRFHKGEMAELPKDNPMVILDFFFLSNISLGVNVQYKKADI